LFSRRFLIAVQQRIITNKQTIKKEGKRKRRQMNLTREFAYE